MGTLEQLGVEGIPKIELTGFLSSTWIYVLIVVLIGLILVIVAAIVIFFTVFKKKVIVFENIAGQGYQPVFRSRARVLKTGVGGAEVMKTLFGGHFVSAYGRKMGKNVYWYAKGSDGYWYNVILGDLDAKMGILDIEPIDRDVRMFHIALDRLSHSTYGKQKWLEKYGVHLLLFAFLIVLILGMWFIVGKIGDAVAPLSQSTERALEIQEMNVKITNELAGIARGLGVKVEEKEGVQEIPDDSGLVPAPPT